MPDDFLPAKVEPAEINPAEIVSADCKPAGSTTRLSDLSASRRTFLGALGLVPGSGLVLAAGPADAGNLPVRQLAADVLVIGGGTAGTIAAIQAGRLGVRTVLVEAGSQLGGTMTTGGVDFPGLFWAWGRQIIAGIGWELVQQAAELNGDPLPDFSLSVGEAQHRHPRFQVRLRGGLYAALAEEACLAAEVALRYYECPVAVKPDGEGWLVELVGKGTRAEVRCRTLIDCTGNASVVALAGLPRLREQETQPGSILFTLTRPTTANPTGSLPRQQYVLGADPSTSETHTDANIRGRQAFLKMFRALRKQPGNEELKLGDLRPETAARETYRIVGETIISREEYESGKRYPDAVAYAYYPVDLHTPGGVRPQHLKEGTVPTIPLGALVPRGSRNLMVAGRCISSDRLANSALRVQAPCMAMGQAAGAACALAVQRGSTPAAVPLERLRQVLAEQGAIVPAGA